MERVLNNTTATISVTYYTGGTVVDPGTVTVTITKANGIPVVTGAATTGSGANARSFTLSPAQVALPDTLTAVWASGSLGSLTTKVEVVGGFLFTTAQLRALVPDATAYPDDKLREARIYAETELERALGFAMVPRYERRTVVARRADRLKLRPFVRVVRAATIGGTPLSAANITNLVYYPSGYVGGYAWWNGVVVADYEHGLDADSDLSSGANRAALALAVEYLGGDAAGTGVDPRAERLITDDGTIVYGSTSAGPFSVPAVNQWVQANRLPLVA